MKQKHRRRKATKKQENPGLKKAITHFNGIPGLQKALGLGSRHAIYMWEGVVPVSRAYQIELLTKGAIKAVELNPKATSAA